MSKEDKIGILGATGVVGQEMMKILEERKEKLLYYPAAQKNHHAELGGLLYHMKRMLMTAERVCEVYTNLDRELLMASGAKGVMLPGGNSVQVVIGLQVQQVAEDLRALVF